jgi:hypothetical protein
LDGLADSCETYGVNLIGYVLMQNKTIDYGWLLTTYYGEDSAKSRRLYRQFVYDAMGAEIENPFEAVVHQCVLGTEEFVAGVKKKLPQKGQREMSSLKNRTAIYLLKRKGHPILPY